MQSEQPFDRAKLKSDLAALAARNIFIGTSSWKYPGWCGQIYTQDRYVYRGKFAETRFNRLCLAEYAETFKTVCVDAAYYKFPDQRYLEGLVADLPSDFQLSLKVTDEVTIKKFTNLPRFGFRAGKPNENFLNADLFISAFLGPCELIKPHIGVVMFEFSRFYPSDFARGRDFIEVLEPFLAKLPQGWRYGIEIRNKHFLHPEYFEALGRHGVAHVYNSWEGMPAVEEQLAMPGIQTTAGFSATRFLLKPGRKYEEAVSLFSPYNQLKEVDQSGRKAGAQLIRQAKTSPTPRPTYIYVNNRFEGNAPWTVQAMIDLAEAPT